jgi:DNA-binding NtrC family response regulator
MRIVEQMAEAKERVILVVEDNPDRPKSLRVLLEIGGHVAIECSARREALKALEKIGVDLMTLGLSMPDVDGFDLPPATRSKHPELKSAVVSEFLRGVWIELPRLGAAVTLDKNLAADTLLRVVRDLLNPIELTPQLSPSK